MENLNNSWGFCLPSYNCKWIKAATLAWEACGCQGLRFFCTQRCRMKGSGGKGLTQVMALGCFVKPQTFSSKFPFRRKNLLRMNNWCAVFLTMEKWMSSAQVVDCCNYGNMPLRSLFKKKHSVKCEGSWCSVPLGSITVFELKSCSP